MSKLSQHLTIAKRLLRYWKGTLDKELCYKKNESEKLTFVAYSDVDWVADQKLRPDGMSNVAQIRFFFLLICH